MAFRFVSSYYKCPVTKGLIGCMFVISASLHAPSLSILRNTIAYSFTDIVYKFNWWRLFTSKIALVDVKDLACCSLLFHFFRVFERRYGSRNYSSLLLSNLVISSLFELGIVYSLRSYSDVNLNFLPSGPIAIVFSLFVKFFSEIPNSSNVLIFGIPVTSKTLHYFLGLQLLNSRGKFVSAIAGLLSGLLFQFTSPFISIPKSFGSLMYKLFSWIDSDAPEDSPIPLGATLEIQREQQMEILEQEMMLNSFRELRNSQMSSSNQNVSSNGGSLLNTIPPVTEAAASSSVRNIFHLPPGYLDNSSSSPGAVASTSSGNSSSAASLATDESFDAIASSFVPSPLPSTSSTPYIEEVINTPSVASESDISTLLEMGFERSAVIEALENSRNDLTEAALCLSRAPSLQ